jgi:hypothetical protein
MTKMKIEKSCKKCKGGIRQWQENEYKGGREEDKWRERSRMMGGKKKMFCLFILSPFLYSSRNHYFTTVAFYLVTFV